MSEQPGRDRLIAGRYRLLSPLGEGGMGTVWRAHDEVLQREVAVKEVRAPAGLPAGDVERMYARLEREAWAAARVAHPNVVTVYDVAMEGGRPWIVMELVRGRSLADVLETTGPLSVTETARVGAEVLDALRAAHDVGVLHRDVKSANVLLSDDGRVVLTDFGIASVEGSSALTMAGEVIGSPEFLSPERALGRTPGPESDLWSLGVLLYAAVEGGSPFRHDTPLATLRAVVDEPLPPPRLAGRRRASEEPRHPCPRPCSVRDTARAGSAA
ncbi:serine/threonine-protein kinase, partial [Streptomyces seoulensis]|uniref:serine/threonine-protein kinase n=1 Tax=Streptomyces seoulensis TaxID=73044 RepID=UPI0033A2F8C0